MKFNSLFRGPPPLSLSTAAVLLLERFGEKPFVGFTVFSIVFRSSPATAFAFDRS